MMMLFLFCNLFGCDANNPKSVEEVMIESRRHYEQRDHRQVDLFEIGDLTDAARIEGETIHVLFMNEDYPTRYIRNGITQQHVKYQPRDEGPVVDKNNWGNPKRDPVMMDLWEKACRHDQSLTDDERRILGTSEVPPILLKRYSQEECLHLAIMK